MRVGVKTANHPGLSPEMRFAGARGIKLFPKRLQGSQELGLPLVVCCPIRRENGMRGDQALPMAYQENADIEFF